jgi:hypothetical protein
MASIVNVVDGYKEFRNAFVADPSQARVTRVAVAHKTDSLTGKIRSCQAKHVTRQTRNALFITV